MKKLIRLVMTVALLGAGLTITAPGAAASLSCPSSSDVVGSGNTYAILYESPNYNDGRDVQFPDYAQLCLKASSTGALGVPDFKAISYRGGSGLGDGICDGQLATSYHTWNDCASAVRVSIDCHHKVSFYENTNYSGLLMSFSVSGGYSSLNITTNDKFSSMRITYTSVCATSPTL